LLDIVEKAITCFTVLAENDLRKKKAIMVKDRNLMKKEALKQQFLLRKKGMIDQINKIPFHLCPCR